MPTTTPITTLEDHAVTLEDVRVITEASNDLLFAQVDTQPSTGTIEIFAYNNGHLIASGTSISLTSSLIDYELVYVFTPKPNVSGSLGNVQIDFGYKTQFSTQDTVEDFSINVTSVNDAPSGANKTVSTVENTAYTFKSSDFGFTDPNDNPPNFLASVRIISLPTNGSLKDNGVAVSAGQFVSVQDIDQGKFVFTPGQNQSGSAYASFTFEVQDDGGTANGGVNLDPTANTITISVSGTNTAPSGTNNAITILEDSPRIFSASDFGFSDAGDTPPNNFLAVKISALPGAGSLTDNGVAVTAGQLVAVSDITAGKLVFTPAADANGQNYAVFSFQVEDDGGTANGGVNLDPSPNTLTITVLPVNDAPSGTNASKTIRAGQTIVFAAADFGFTDAHDSPANNFAAVKISTLPDAGSLTDKGVAVTAGQLIALADITSGGLVYTPPSGGSSGASTAFTFQVQDDGGTANGGIALDPTPNSFTISILPKNSGSDFNGDGFSDILWQNTNGQAAIWTMNGLTQTGGAQVGGNPGTAWHVIGSGDFNGDGKADILWQNDSGQAAVWTMNGLSQTGGATVGGNPGASWHVKAAADFNGDGKADILWQNDNGQAAIWTMDGLTQTGGASVGGNPGPSWHAVAAADFDGDGKADILWQNDNGQVAIWTMNGLTQTGGAIVGGNPGASWHVKAAADFNGDGKADILWQNDNGQVAIWLMNGLTQIGAATVGGNPGTSWHVIGAGDYNGDGKADILWQNDSGQAAIWTMDGLTQTGGGNIGGNPGASWHIKDTANSHGAAGFLRQDNAQWYSIWSAGGSGQFGQNKFAATHIAAMAG